MCKTFPRTAICKQWPQFISYRMVYLTLQKSRFSSYNVLKDAIVLKWLLRTQNMEIFLHNGPGQTDGMYRYCGTNGPRKAKHRSVASLECEMFTIVIESNFLYELVYPNASYTPNFRTHVLYQVEIIRNNKQYTCTSKMDIR